MLLEAYDLSYYYPNGELVLRNVTLGIDKGWDYSRSRI